MSKLIQKFTSIATIPFDYPTLVLMDSTGSQKYLGQIPAILYQTWETRNLTRRLHKSVSAFRALNPEMSFSLFDAGARDEYMRAHWGDRDIYAAYKDALFGPLKADIFRYCILYERGGFYFDISKGVSKPLRDFLSMDSRELLSFEGNLSHRPSPSSLASRLRCPNQRVAQWGFGFSPKHRILEHQIRSIERSQHTFRNRSFLSPKSAILELSGPISFTESVWKFLLEDEHYKLNQTSIDFNGAGIYSLPGAAGRYRHAASYMLSRNQPILQEFS